MNSTSFHIYNASAGSGKTYALVKEYLKVLFLTSSKDSYKRILAITFTNKAVSEMKTRIIEMLKEFSFESILEFPNEMFIDICNELQIKPNTLHIKSKTILNSIIHNYAAFDISTIDKFTHKLIRSFAHDLRLSMNFEVELDTESLLNEAVDRLISKAGSDKDLTEILINFALEKADEDKSWDVSLDFYKVAKLLVNENDIPYIETFKNKSLEDFKTLNLLLKEKIILSEDTIVNEARSALALILESSLEFNDFSGGYLPKYFENLVGNKFDVNFEAKWQDDIAHKSLYPKRVSEDIALIIDEIQPLLVAIFNKTKKEVYNYKFLKNFYTNITPLSVLNAIQNELKALKEEQNLILISEFNTIISNEIKSQPAPFIYERIGEKFRHFFIDEFQDTSVLQWKNLVPLLENSLSSENGSLILVGDAKQSIYRWRGGKPEQFIDLCNDVNPFQVKKQLKNLPNNYRSHTEIVDFNNAFFKHLSTFAFSEARHSDLFMQSWQKNSIKKQGFVSLSFLETNDDADKHDIHSQKVLETIKDCLKNGFQLKDICVLVRRKKEGVTIADYLSDHDIDIISSETLLLLRSPEIAFIINVLKYLLEPDNKEIKVGILNFLVENKIHFSDKHQFYNSFINLDIDQFFQDLKAYNIYFNYRDIFQLPVYEAVESIICDFKLVESSNAYVQFFLDFVLDYSIKYPSSLIKFLDYYESKKGYLSIVSPQEKNAVQIMTIHKSKGLEFPVVIFPYADLAIYRELEPKEWFPLDSDKFNGFTHSILSYNKDLENFSEIGQQIYRNHQAELELDNLNLLYVALTRPIEQLHVLSSLQLDKKGAENLKLYSGLFINYLKHINKWDENLTSYSFGNPKKISAECKKIKESIEQQNFISKPKKDHNIKIITNSGYLWDTVQQKAIEKGNLIHYIMSHIKTSMDVDITINKFLSSGMINQEQSLDLKPTIIGIVEHPQLIDYFHSANIIYNEKDIITKKGDVLRPDRLVVNHKNEVVIIDYKTGDSNKIYEQQLQVYQDAIEDMGFLVTKKILIYVNDYIEIKEV